MRRELANARRIVIKLGTHVVTGEHGGIALGRVSQIVESIYRLIRQGKQVILVSSGAVGVGRAVLGLQEPPRSLGLRQACAAAGQGQLIAWYTQAFAGFSVPVAQVLLAQEDLGEPSRALCLRTTLIRLLELNTLPILNENDSVSVRELLQHVSTPTGSGNEGVLAFGDNDELSARLALAIDADLLLMLSNVDGLFTANPSDNAKAVRIPRLDRVDHRVKSWTQGVSSGGTGGMKSKVQAAAFAQAGGIDVVMANGDVPQVLDRIIRGEDLGTWIVAAERRPGRLRRIAIEMAVKGALIVNDGAQSALMNTKASLLPIGVVRVEGTFSRADIVEVRDTSGRVLGRGLVNYDSSQCTALCGCHSDEIISVLGFIGYDALINRQNMVLGDVGP